MQIVAGAAERDPVRIELHAGGAEDALAPVEEAELRLCSGIPVQGRIIPAGVLAAAFHLEALEREVALVEAVTGGELEGAERLIRHAGDVVGARLVEAAVEAGICQVADRERVGPEQVVGLPEQHVEEAAA